MLSLRHRQDYCWKCELDIDFKIDEYHHDVKQLTFYQIVLHIKTHTIRKEECFCNLCVAMYSNLLDENHTKTKSNATFNMREINLDEL